MLAPLTVLDILDIEKPKALPGISVLDEKQLAARKTIFGEIYAHDFNTVASSLFYTMAVAKPYKLILPDPKRKPKAKVELFNTDEDPFEKNNIAEQHPEIVEKLKQHIMSSQANTIPGGWSPYSCNINSEANAAFKEAMGRIIGVTYSPVAVSQQVVAGMNYHFFCNTEASTRYPVTGAAIVTIYKELSGEAHVTNIKNID